MKISIITVCYNSQKTIENTIKSTISQTYKNYEYIIIDGGSTDDTIKIINKYKKNINIFKSEKDKGIYDAINKGIKYSTGSVISLLHSDDIFYENTTTLKIMSYFNSNPKLECLIGNTIITKNDLKKNIRCYKANFFKNGCFILATLHLILQPFLEKKFTTNMVSIKMNIR